MASSEASRHAIDGLEPQRLWKYFLDLTRIPRESGNERAVRQYLVDFATREGLAYHIDGTGKLIIKAPPSPGMAQVPSLALREHMVMVCVKDDGVVLDFEKDPLVSSVMEIGCTPRGDFGADMASRCLDLDLFSDKEAKHGPLKPSLRCGGEGSRRAFGLDDSKITSKRMLTSTARLRASSLGWPGVSR
jgi:dipeptidase D